MKKAKLIKRDEIAKQVQRKNARKGNKPAKITKQAVETVRSWVRQRQTAQQSAYQAFADLFAEPQTKGTA